MVVHGFWFGIKRYFCMSWHKSIVEPMIYQLFFLYFYSSSNCFNSLLELNSKNTFEFVQTIITPINFWKFVTCFDSIAFILFDNKLLATRIVLTAKAQSAKSAGWCIFDEKHSSEKNTIEQKSENKFEVYVWTRVAHSLLKLLLFMSNSGKLK